MDQPKISRMLRLMKYLSGNENNTIDDLAKKLGMSYRTIYRYIDTFKDAGFAVTKLYGNVYKLGSIPRNAPDFDKLIYFSEEEAYLVNNLIDRLDPTNTLKGELKKKLAAIYNSTSIADYVDKHSNAGNVQSLADAIRGKKKVVLKHYESGNSDTIRDRAIEPFSFTTNYIDVWGYDPEDGHNKTFKVARIEEVEILDEKWEFEKKHRTQGRDIFRMGGHHAIHVCLQMTTHAKNLLCEEYPLAEKEIKSVRSKWYLDTDLYNMKGACRFYVGLSDEIRIIDSPEFKAYVDEFVKKNLK